MPCDEHFYTLLTIIPCLVSSIVSQLFPPRDHLQICGSQHSRSALWTDGNRSVTNRPDIIRPGVCSRCFSYETRPGNLLSGLSTHTVYRIGSKLSIIIIIIITIIIAVIFIASFLFVLVYMQEYGFVWCWNLDASGSRSEIPGKFWNVVLEKDGEDQLDRLCEKWISVT